MATSSTTRRDSGTEHLSPLQTRARSLGEYPGRSLAGPARALSYLQELDPSTLRAIGDLVRRDRRIFGHGVSGHGHGAFSSDHDWDCCCLGGEAQGSAVSASFQPRSRPFAILSNIMNLSRSQVLIFAGLAVLIAVLAFFVIKSRQDDGGKGTTVRVEQPSGSKGSGGKRIPDEGRLVLTIPANYDARDRTSSGNQEITVFPDGEREEAAAFAWFGEQPSTSLDELAALYVRPGFTEQGSVEVTETTMNKQKALFIVQDLVTTDQVSILVLGRVNKDRALMITVTRPLAAKGEAQAFARQLSGGARIEYGD